ncbi:MAG: dTDP-Rha--alpha-D-GlcNAc-pyrophosphate polyprenol alpha-3-L-rhamnosyltransferase [Beggiatoa sp. IS2]|nr:MAG: dTDP-Rha--alpha-D-GlcNAc-pyrophosphate polyprenol alpha-3-L-rhamnosyltransferase [Beggiatoa sp. IS2]
MSIDNTIAVIIVNFNAGSLLTQCVHAAMNSTVSVIVYVIDNGSTDESISQLKQAIELDERVHIIRNNINYGFARAANQALPQITSPYILFLNPDCLIKTDTLARFRETMKQYPQAGMAGGLVRNLDGSEQAGCRRSIPSPWRSMVRVFHLDQLFPHHPRFQSFVLTDQPLPSQPVEIEGISGACMFVRQTALQEVGAMDETYFLHGEDLDWFMRFRAHHWSILFIPEIEVTHIKGACSRSQPLRVLWYKHRSMVRFYRKFFRRQYPFIMMVMVVIAVWIRFAILALVTFITPQKP